MERTCGQFDPPLWFFQKCIFMIEYEAVFFVTFNIFTSHAFGESFIEIFQVIQKI